jgi:protease PrsW
MNLLYLPLVLGWAVIWYYDKVAHREAHAILGAPAAINPNSQTSRRWSRVAIFLALMAVMISFYFVEFGDATTVLLAGSLAMLPVPCLLALVYWLDRMEPEPPQLVLATFVWGATAAVISALVFESLAKGIAASFLNDAAALSNFVTDVCAPVIEEGTKGVALWCLFIKYRDAFNDVIDGIIYAALVGLGFAMSENILYYGNALLHGGATNAAILFGLRGLMSPYAHPLYTAVTGIGFGLAAHNSKYRFLPWLTYIAAVALHMLWNYSANLGGGFFVVYAVVMVPIFFLTIKIVSVSRKKEEQLLRQYLQPDCAAGRLSVVEFERICDGRTRMRDAVGLAQRGQFRILLLRRSMQLVGKQLAFFRYRAASAPVPDTSLPDEAAYQLALQKIRDAITAREQPPPLPAA